MAGAGYKLFNTGDVLTAAQVNTYLMQQTVMVFASATARNTALSGILAEGLCCYLSDVNDFQIYDGSSWVSYGSGDITGVTAGTGLTGGGTSGSVTLAIDTATTVDKTTAQALTNKDLSSATNTFPTSLVTLTGSQTLTNKTLTSPIVSTISNTGTLTLPTSTDTLVGRATTDTLTNKTLTAPKITLNYTAKTATYTIADGDQNGFFTMNAATSQNFQIPTDATFNFAIGTEIHFAWITGAGQPSIVAVTPATTTIVSTGATSASPKLRVANSAATAIKLAANSWIVVGDLA